MDRVPSIIFAKHIHDSCASLETLGVDASEELGPPPTPRGSSFRGFGEDSDRSHTTTSLSMAPSIPRRISSSTSSSMAPSIPRRISSKGFGFNRKNSGLSRGGGNEGSTANAKFDLSKYQPKASSNSKPSLMDRLLAQHSSVVSPSPSMCSKKSRMSLSSTDTPLTMPRRKPSQQSLLSPGSKGSSNNMRKKYSGIRNITSMTRINEGGPSVSKNASFGNLKKNDGFATPTKAVKRYFTNSPLRI